MSNVLVLSFGMLRDHVVIPLTRPEIDLTCTTGRPTGITAPLGVGAEFGLLPSYSRRRELEADRLGLYSAAGIRPVGRSGAVAAAGRVGRAAARAGVPVDPPGALCTASGRALMSTKGKMLFGETN